MFKLIGLRSLEPCSCLNWAYQFRWVIRYCSNWHGVEVEIKPINNHYYVYLIIMYYDFAARIRGSAASIATSFNWFITFNITFSFNQFENHMGILFMVYGACCLLSLVFVRLCVPETQGKSLEDIERNLAGSGPKIPVRTARRMSSIANLKPTPGAV